jgi:hypothetical protein
LSYLLFGTPAVPLTVGGRASRPPGGPGFFLYGLVPRRRRLLRPLAAGTRAKRVLTSPLDLPIITMRAKSSTETTVPCSSIGRAAGC